MVSAVVQSLMVSAKEARDEELLLASLRTDFHIISMIGNGDCGFELMQHWRDILACRRRGKAIPQSFHSSNQRWADQCHETCHCRFAASRGCTSEQRRHACPRQAKPVWLEQESPGEWWEEQGGIRRFCQSSRIGGFSLLEKCSLAIYIPGDCQFFPQSKNLPADTDVLVGVCSGNHYYLAVPKAWTTEVTDDATREERALLSSGRLIPDARFFHVLTTPCVHNTVHINNYLFKYAWL